MAYSHKWSYSTFTALTLALAGLVGCGGSDTNTPPQTPQATNTDTTQTTGASGTTGAMGSSTATGTDMSGTPSGASPGSAGSSMGSAGSTTPAPDTTPAPKAEAPLSDEQIAAVTNAANTGEVDQAKEAVKKAKNAKVKAFANEMIKDHGEAYKKQNEILKKASLTASDNPVAMQITTDGKQVMSTLNAATGADFDKAYMDAQVKEHQQVLDNLDNKLIPSAKNAELKAHLQTIRTKVAHHLKMAQDLQGSLK
jgi:putative membrane protein